MLTPQKSFKKMEKKNVEEETLKLRETQQKGIVWQYTDVASIKRPHVADYHRGVVRGSCLHWLTRSR